LPEIALQTPVLLTFSFAKLYEAPRITASLANLAATAGNG